MRATKKAASDLSGDLGRQVSGPTTSVNATPAQLALAIRVRAPLYRRTWLATMIADWAVTRLERAHRRWEQLKDRTTAVRFTERLLVVTDHDRRSTLLGDLTAFVPGFVTTALIVVMAVNDPGVVYLTLRGLLDVPTSVGTFDMRNVSVLIALTAAAGIALAVVAAVLWGAHSIVALLYWRRLDAAGRYPGVEESVAQVGRPQLILNVVTSLIALAGAMALLHLFSTARFGGLLDDIKSIDGSGSEAGHAVIWQITLLPLLLLLVEVVNLSPPMKHRRDAARWSRWLRFVERWDIRADQRGARRVSQRRRKAGQRLEHVQDLSNLGVLAGDTEITRAAIEHGGIDTAALAPMVELTDCWGSPAADAAEVPLTGVPVQGLSKPRSTDEPGGVSAS